MYFRILTIFVAGLLLVGSSSHLANATGPSSTPVFTLLATYTTGLGNLSGETVAVSGNRMYVTNSNNNSLDIVDLSTITNPTRITRIDLSPYGASPNSVAVRDDLVAVAVEANPKTDPGSVVFFNAQG